MKHLHFASIDSTNNYAKQLINEERARADSTCTDAASQTVDAAQSDIEQLDGLLISADEQTAGRGRRGRSFSSLAGNGIYMSLILRVNETPENCMLITPAAAVGVVQALDEAMTGAEGEGIGSARIKWVNDIYLEDRKVCGILTESVFGAEPGRIEYVVIGIGMNINADISRMPEDVAAVAGTVTGLSCTAQEMIPRIAEQVARCVSDVLHDGRGKVMQIYRERSLLIGKEIRFDDADGRHYAKAVDINDSGNLIIEENGRTRTLFSGEVSVRRIE